MVTNGVSFRGPAKHTGIEFLWRFLWDGLDRGSAGLCIWTRIEARHLINGCLLVLEMDVLVSDCGKCFVPIGKFVINFAWCLGGASFNITPH